MRLAALLLLLSLAGPVSAGAVCGLSCLGARDAAARAAGGEDCHRAGTGGDGVTLGPTDAACHATPAGPAAVRPITLLTFQGGGAVLPRPGIARVPVLTAAPLPLRAYPPDEPDILRITTQLRV